MTEQTDPGKRPTRARSILTSVGELAGAATAAVGFGLFSLPLGVIVAGVSLIAFSWLAD